jgi:hypothetical protein
MLMFSLCIKNIKEDTRTNIMKPPTHQSPIPFKKI